MSEKWERDWERGDVETWEVDEEMRRRGDLGRKLSLDGDIF